MEQKNYTPFYVRDLCLGAGIPKICVPLVAADMEEIRNQLTLIQSGPHDLIEWRADYFGDVMETEKVLEALQMIRAEIKETVLLFTFRTRPEGGEREITPEDYEKLCLTAAASGFTDLIDVEYHLGDELLLRLIPALQKTGVGVIGSCHDFEKTPDGKEIRQTLCAMQKLDADITKMAVMPKNRLDVVTLLQASAEMEEYYADRPFITMSMGKTGAVSRLAGCLTGSALTFAAAGRASAPGQMSAEGIRGALDLLG